VIARRAAAAPVAVAPREAAPPLLRPFRALRYAPEVGPLDDLVAPPAGVVRERERVSLLARHVANVSHVLELEEPVRAAETWRGWLRDRVVVVEDEPAAWLVEEAFLDSRGDERRRRGVVAQVRVEPHRRGLVLAHESTGAPGRRLWREHLRRLGACVAPLLVLHDGPEPRPPDREPDLAGGWGGIAVRAWRVAEPGALEALLGSVTPPLVIADGHHRFQAALQLRAPALLAHVVSARDPGVEACALHRLAITSRTLRPAGFRRVPLVANAREGLGRLERLRSLRPAFVLLRADGAELLVAEEAHRRGHRIENDLDAVRRLGPTLLGVTARLEEVEDLVASVRDALGILLRKPEVDDVVAVARAGRTLPQKSTSFEPKPLCGLVFSSFG
jgi:uncharacterized protein DUF1015